MYGSSESASVNTRNGGNEHYVAESATRSCTLCGRTSVCSCQNCGDFYCSPACQRKDWPSHRYICFPMPPLVHVSNLPGGSVNKSEIPFLIEPGSVQKQKINQHKPNNTSNGNGQFVTVKEKQEGYNNKQRFARPNLSSFPKSDSCVVVTGFRSPNRFFVRAFKGNDNDNFLLVTEQINTYGKSAPLLQELPKPNSYAITAHNSFMRRVEVISVRDAKNIRVAFCDYGFTAVRQLSELHEISEEVLTLKQYTVMVQLRNVENYTLTDGVTKFLTKFIDKEFKIKFGPEDERGANVELFLWQSQESLNDKIRTFCSNMGILEYVDANIRGRDGGNKYSEVNTTLVDISSTNKHKNLEKRTTEQIYHTKSSSKQESLKKGALNSTTESTLETCAPVSTLEIVAPVLNPPFQTKPFKKGTTNIKAIVVDDTCLDFGYFGCIFDGDFNHLAAIQQFLKAYQPEELQPYKPRLNEYCIAKFEDDWYRAKVLEILDEDQFNVFYIDFTNECTIPSKDIRRYPMDLKLDCRTNLCLIVGLPPNLSKEYVKFLRNEIKLQSTIKIDNVKGVEDGILLVECQDIIKKQANNI